MGFNCLKATEPPRRNSFLFSVFFFIKSSEVPGTHLIELGKIKD